MVYQPINESNKAQWIQWLEIQAAQLQNVVEDRNENALFGTEEGDVANAKDLVGNLLATLTNQPVIIN